jgi:hypothetical protein
MWDIIFSFIFSFDARLHIGDSSVNQHDDVYFLKIIVYLPQKLWST